MPGGKGNIMPSDGKQFSKEYQPEPKWTEEEALKFGNNLLSWLKAADENIFYEEFIFLVADENDYKGKIYVELPAYLAKKFSSFFNLLQKCAKIEEIKLKKFGSFDKLNAGLVKFLLSANYGYTDKTALDHTNDGIPDATEKKLSKDDFSEMTDAELRNTIHTISPALRKKLGISENDIAGMQRELNNRSFYEFFKYYWHIVSTEELIENWHLKFLCDEAQEIAERVGSGEEKEHDLLINIPPGTTKTTILSIMLPAWCWTRWHWMKFITASYSQTLSLESAETCRDLIRSDKFRTLYPEIEIKADKDVKSNYKVVKRTLRNDGNDILSIGGGRFTTSVGGSVTGFHCHIFIWDDPLNPKEAASDVILEKVNRWIDGIISTRKIDKAISTTIGIMQRLHENDPSGHLLSKKKTNLRHICLPAELDNYADKIHPKNLSQYYIDNLLDPIRMSRAVLEEMEKDMGSNHYAGQIGQNPAPPGGNKFKVENLHISKTMPLPHEIDSIVRYWDKAGTDARKTKGKGAWTAGVEIAKLKDGTFMILDVVRGQWAAPEREKMILQTAQTDGVKVRIGQEQEPGSGGKESAENTVRNLAGFNIKTERPVGDKELRADPFSIQVEAGNVKLLYGEWNHAYIEELRYFPYSKTKDQVDASSAGFAMLTGKKKVRTK